MLAAVGETFETPFTNPSDSTSPAPAPPSEPLSSTFANDVTGVIVSARKAFYRINIWTRTSDSVSKERVLNVGRQFKYGGQLAFGFRVPLTSPMLIIFASQCWEWMRAFLSRIATRYRPMLNSFLTVTVKRRFVASSPFRPHTQLTFS